MPKQHTPKPLSSLFGQSTGKLARIAEKSQYLNALNQNLAEAVGATIAQNCRVGNYDQGILTIETVNSAFATRLNFMLSGILLSFRRNVLPELCDIRIKVVPNTDFYATKNQPLDKHASYGEKQVGENHSKPKKPTQAGNATEQKLSTQAAGYIKEAASSAPPSLKEKLEKLAGTIATRNQQ